MRACVRRRKRYVELTRKGRSLLPRARRLWRRAENRFERIFGKDSAAELRAVLLDIANNSDLKMYPAPPHSIFPALRKERWDLAPIVLRLETSGRVLLGS